MTLFPFLTSKSPDKAKILSIFSFFVIRYIQNFFGTYIQVSNDMTFSIKIDIGWISVCCNRNPIVPITFSLHVKISNQFNAFVRLFSRKPCQFLRRRYFVALTYRIYRRFLGTRMCHPRFHSTKRLPHGKQPKHYTQSTCNCKLSHTPPLFFPKIEKK
ncbi:hypothetical protein SAMN05720471_13913 [Fibrobacter sp. UWP2]|nr:hypothetical protein SAMN05720471_13913 [Fibrobacter sp. UWP2]